MLSSQLYVDCFRSWSNWCFCGRMSHARVFLCPYYDSVNQSLPLILASFNHLIEIDNEHDTGRSGRNISLCTCTAFWMWGVELIYLSHSSVVSLVSTMWYVFWRSVVSPGAFCYQTFRLGYGAQTFWYGFVCIVWHLLNGYGYCQGMVVQPTSNISFVVASGCSGYHTKYDQ